jgi:WhiB family redox-sensing transcriptional regulator
MKPNFNFAFGNAQRWESAHCANTIFPDLFFPSSVEEIEASEPMIQAICKNCPVRQECLQLALDNKDFNGYFGGVSPEDRRKMSAHRSRVRRGNSKEVIRLMEMGWSLKDACDEVGILPASFAKWKNQETKTNKDKDKK